MVRNVKKSGPCRFVSDQMLTSRDIEVLSAAMAHSGCKENDRLAGRATMARVTLEGFDKAVVKSYFRGGIVRHFVKRHYFRWGKLRCEAEYDMLKRLRALGVNVPKPLAYAFQGSLFYKAWLITKEIDSPQSLFDLSLKNEPDLPDLLGSLACQVALLIEHKIRHIDLHPGNVLVDRSGKVYLVDFDKAGVYRGSRSGLGKRYIERWNRAVRKYNLPNRLQNDFSVSLKKALEQTNRDR